MIGVKGPKDLELVDRFAELRGCPGHLVLVSGKFCGLASGELSHFAMENGYL